ncbi:hypothetical protein YC2023_086565 [Brassica napus]
MSMLVRDTFWVVVQALSHLIGEAIRVKGFLEILLANSLSNNAFKTVELNSLANVSDLQMLIAITRFNAISCYILVLVNRTLLHAVHYIYMGLAVGSPTLNYPTSYIWSRENWHMRE